MAGRVRLPMGTPPGSMGVNCFESMSWGGNLVAKSSFQRAYRQILLSKGVIDLMGKAPVFGRGFLVSIFIIEDWKGGLCNGYLVLFVWVGRVWGLTRCFAGVF